MAATISMNFVSCMRNLDKKNAEEITNLLKQKYGIEFVVKSIGNRNAGNMWSTVTAFCYPENNPKVIFEAVMNVDKELVSDEYPVRLLEIEAKDIIEKEFSENNITATVNVSISRVSDLPDILNMNLEQVIFASPKLGITFKTVVCEGADTKSMYETTAKLLKRFYNGNPEMIVGTTIWKYDKEAYEKCASELNSIPRIGNTALQKHGPLSTVNVAINTGEINIGFEDFSEKF